MKLNKTYLIVAIVLVVLGVGSLIAGAILSLYHHQQLSDIFFGLTALFGVSAFCLLVYALMIAAKNGPVQRPTYQKTVVKTVDVKDIPKSQEQKLYEQYEELYKKNLISKEDLDSKRKELLGK